MDHEHHTQRSSLLLPSAPPEWVSPPCEVQQGDGTSLLFWGKPCIICPPIFGIEQHSGLSLVTMCMENLQARGAMEDLSNSIMNDTMGFLPSFLFPRFG
eukprot:scaffold818_cov136-Cylindrotheca_fusiformis.AAC.22